MGHRINRVERLFSDVVYNYKSSDVLRKAMSAKVEELRVRIAERGVRTQRIRDEYSIDAEKLAVLLMRFQQDDSGFVSYEKQGGESVVPAGVIANLVREREMIDNEQEQITKLELVQRNLMDDVQFAVHGTGEIKMRPAVHELSDDELEYLGF
ncbi:MAG: hypothetical protein ACI8RZ_004507 [Myxococcota bacterium]|jgi:hypothetical protein